MNKNKHKMNRKLPKRFYRTRKASFIHRWMQGLPKLNYESVESPLVFSEDDVIFEGYLYMGLTIDERRLKYCILRADTWTLCCYKHPYDLVLCGEYMINTDDIIIDKNDENVENNTSTIEIQRIRQKTSVYFTLQDDDTKLYWMEALNHVKRRENEKVVVKLSTTFEHDNQNDENQEPSQGKRMTQIVSKDYRETKLQNNETSGNGMDNQRHHKSPVLRPTQKFVEGNHEFEVDIKYQIIKVIGTGAYGAVVAAKNRYTGEHCAIKKIPGVFTDLVDAKRILREVRLLRHFNHLNITAVLDILPPPSVQEFEDIYIVTELMETDLHKIINSNHDITDSHIKYFLYQMLCGIYHIHSAGVLHRDMKPSNILLNSDCELKICDFGLARAGFKDNLELSEYVVTRWYRAPEIILNCTAYGEAIDIWSIGCILGEMLQQEALFPGEHYIHQLELIIEFLGTPKQEDVEHITSAKALKFLAKQPILKPSNIHEEFPNANPLVLDLLKKMLVFNPRKRISVLDALKHPYLQEYYDKDDIIISSEPIFDDEIADADLTKEEIQRQLFSEVCHFHPDLLLPRKSRSFTD